MAKSSAAKSKKKPADSTAHGAKAPQKAVAAEVKAGTPVKATAPGRTSGLFARIGRGFNRELTPQSLLAELGGTFILVSSVLFTSGDAFFTGLTVLVLASGIFAISGAHLNPAVTFALWAGRSISIYRALLYWVAQFVGAIAAIVLVNLFSGATYDLSLASFWQFDAKIFFAELFGTAVFLFGLAAAVNRNQTDLSRAAGIGLSLFLGLVIATGLLSKAVQGVTQTATGDNTSQSRLEKVNSVALNPAVALALTERDSQSSLTSNEDAQKETPASRLTIEVIFGTFLGGAAGLYLYRLLSRSSARS